MGASTSEKPRIHFLSPLRIIMFLVVVFNHAESFARVRTGTDPLADAFFALSPDGRYLFITITVFLIARSSSTSSAVRRLFVLVWPFLVWSVLYAGFEVLANGIGSGGLGGIALTIVTGSAAPHLYFVIVTIQLTLLAPLIRALANAVRRWPMVWIIAAAVAQFGVVSLELVSDRVEFPILSFCVAYPLYVVGGTVLAVHLEPATAWFRAHASWLFGALCAVGAVYVGAVIAVGEPQGVADELLLRELRCVWTLAVALTAVAVSMRLVASSGRWSSVTKRAGTHMQDLGYGLFLAHMLVLRVMSAAVAPFVGSVPFTVLTVALWIGAVIATLGFVIVVRRTPFSSSLTGRPMSRRTVPTPAFTPA